MEVEKGAPCSESRIAPASVYERLKSFRGVDLPIAERMLLWMSQGVMAMWNEFKEFALKGNVFDLAVALIIGLAFTKIVDSLVNDLIMPVIGAVTGGIDFSNYFVPLSRSVTSDTLAAAKEQGAVLAYGNFLTVVVNFLIVAFVLFLLVRTMNKFKRRTPVPVATPPKIEALLEDIRDLLAGKAKRS
jgi:large conductance mechanosensitive channel